MTLSHTPLNITREQRANLERLAAFLLTVDAKKFNMRVFHSDSRRDLATTEHPCGTVACAVGWGPSAGVDALEGEDWVLYARRVFTTDSDTWSWLFASDWVRIDNTPTGAAARIRYTLDHGVPENHDDQMFGDDPLCYVREDA